MPSTDSDRLRKVSVPASTPVGNAGRNLDPDLYINRELSWLQFNARVLANAADPELPLYERLKFLAIFSSNLDEFFMVRAAGLQAQLSSGIEELPPDAMTPRQQLEAIGMRAHELLAEQYRIWTDGIRPELRRVGVALVTPAELTAEDRGTLARHFERDIFPVLTPIAVDPVHPFPHVRNKCINVAVLFQRQEHSTAPEVGVVQVPMTLPRLVRVPLEGARRAFVLLEDLIFQHREMIFPQMQIVGHFAFRVTRNFDIQIDEDEAEDLLLVMQEELLRRERGHAVRLEISSDAPEHAIELLCRELDLDPDQDAYRLAGPLVLGDMTQMTKHDDRPQLKDEPFSPQYVPPFRDSDDFFETIRESDVLLHHPYESFEAVIDFLFQAAEDPQVLAIKQTLYRTGGESPNVRALQRAAENGKHVTVLVELKARFDEQSNIQWARELERSGVNVMYGLLGLKTHAKVLLVVRKERVGLRRYVHLATGNYNEQTARLYEDLSYFTAREELGEDATAIFNLLTGYSAPARWNKLIVAPLGLHHAVLGLIERETEHANQGRPARIIAKMNSLVDPDVIAALYDAAKAGVEIDLLLRGICCLRPGVPGVSDRIRVHAVIDRFLEHARIFYFSNGGAEEVYCSSADWMPRNFRRRVETMFPILDQDLRHRVVNEILEIMRRDNTNGWLLRPDGNYERVLPVEGEPVVRSQQRFMELARERAREDKPILSTRKGYGGADGGALVQLARKGRRKRRRPERNR